MMTIANLGIRAQKYDPTNNFRPSCASWCIFSENKLPESYLARCRELLWTMQKKMRFSIHLLLHFEMHSSSIMTSYSSWAIESFILLEMIKKWHLCMKYTSRRIKVAIWALKICPCILSSVLISMGGLSALVDLFRTRKNTKQCIL